MNRAALSAELMAARDAATRLPLPTARLAGFSVDEAYAVAEEIRNLRVARGERSRGYKIGFNNRSIWPRYDVHTPIWAPVWSSTITFVDGPDARVSLAGPVQPRLESEIVFDRAAARGRCVGRPD